MKINAKRGRARRSRTLDDPVLSQDFFDPETLNLMSRAFDAAWNEVGIASRAEPTAIRTLMSVRIMTAVRDGQRNPERLKELALEAIAKAY